MDKLIVGHWCVPRSASTAFEKCFSQRTDTTIVHEPFTNCYYFSNWRRSDRYGDYEGMVDYSSEKCIELINESDGSIVFFKELGFQALHYTNMDFFASIKNTFMIQHPLFVLESLYKLKPDFSEEEFGFTALYELWLKVTQVLKQETLVVDSNTFRSNPEKTLQIYCAHLNIDYQINMPKWESGRIAEWEPHESESQAKWHSTLEQSNGILPPDFVLPNIDIRPEHEEIYHRALEIYELLKSNC